MTETEGRQWLKRKLYRFDIVLQPIESGGTGVGIPDLFMQANKSLWIELKIGHYVAQGVRVVFRPGQLQWIQNHVRLGGEARMLMFTPHEEGKDFAWWVFKGQDVKPFYFMHELADKGVGYLTGNVDGAKVLEVLLR